ncbi:MAG: hypothetical protein IJ187_06610 [Neisseriaceae bacterium]|nr:hypothetical protein [Neisseriaceae bacterium]
MKRKIQSLAKNLHTNEFKNGGLGRRNTRKHEWHFRSSYIYLNECKTPQEIETALINSGFNNVWVAINKDIFSSTSCIGDVNFSIKAKPQGGRVCMNLNISDSWEKGRNLDKPQCWNNSTQQIEKTVSTFDDKKLSSKNDESVEKYAEMESKIKSLAKSLSANKFEYLGLYRLGRYEWKSKSLIYLDDCLNATNIQTALLDNQFNNISSTIGADSYYSTACIGDVNFHIKSKAKNGKVCGKVNIEYSWQKGRNLDNPKCWDTPNKTEDPTTRNVNLQ